MGQSAFLNPTQTIMLSTVWMPLELPGPTGYCCIVIPESLKTWKIVIAICWRGWSDVGGVLLSTLIDKPWCHPGSGGSVGVLRRGFVTGSGSTSNPASFKSIWIVYQYLCDSVSPSKYPVTTRGWLYFSASLTEQLSNFGRRKGFRNSALTKPFSAVGMMPCA